MGNCRNKIFLDQLKKIYVIGQNKIIIKAKNQHITKLLKISKNAPNKQ